MNVKHYPANCLVLFVIFCCNRFQLNLQRVWNYNFSHPRNDSCNVHTNNRNPRQFLLKKLWEYQLWWILTLYILHDRASVVLYQYNWKLWVRVLSLASADSVNKINIMNYWSQTEKLSRLLSLHISKNRSLVNSAIP